MQNNISFQGKTNLILSDKQYLIKAAQTRRANHFVASDSVHFVKSNNFGVDTKGGKLVVFVKNDKSGIIRNFYPGTDLQEILLSLENKIEHLKKISNKKLTAWILGGKTNDDKTIKAVNDVADLLCDRPDIDTSILAGARIPNTDNVMLYGRVTDTDIVFPKLDGISKPQDLEDAFDIVELNNVKFDVR